MTRMIWCNRLLSIITGHLHRQSSFTREEVPARSLQALPLSTACWPALPPPLLIAKPDVNLSFSHGFLWSSIKDCEEWQEAGRGSHDDTAHTGRHQNVEMGLLGRDEPRWDCAQTLVARIHKCWLPDGWSTSMSCACLKHCKYDCWSILRVSYFSELKMSRHLICTPCSLPNSLALSSCNSGPTFTAFIFWKCAESQMWVCDWFILTHSLRLTVPHLNSETFAHIRGAHLLSPIPFNFVKPCRQKL